MIPQIRVDGARDLARIQRALRTAPPAMRRELGEGIKEGTEPMRKAAEANILPVLPKRGGVNVAVHADTQVVARRRGGRAGAGIRISAKSRRSVQQMDKGRLRHPLFGNRGFWFTQSITPGWFTKPMLEGATGVRKALVKHLDQLAEKIARSAS